MFKPHCPNAPFPVFYDSWKYNSRPRRKRNLEELAEQSGRRTDDLVEDAMAGYVEELVKVRAMLNNRYDDLKSGRVKAIPGDEVEAHFREKSAAARRSQPGS